MLNLANFMVFESRDGSSGVTLILYTAHCRSSAAVLTEDEGSFDLKIVTPFQSGNGWGRERSKIRRLITDKRRKRSMFVERLIKLDQEFYERYASVGARGEPIGN
jgi:hypothetical protein